MPRPASRRPPATAATCSSRPESRLWLRTQIRRIASAARAQTSTSAWATRLGSSPPALRTRTKPPTCCWSSRCRPTGRASSSARTCRWSPRTRTAASPMAGTSTNAWAAKPTCCQRRLAAAARPPTSSFAGSTADGSLVHFQTAEPLLPSDTDTSQDVYSVRVNAPPDCSNVTATPAVLLPANHHFAAIALQGGTDPDGDAVSLAIDGVTQDEPVAGKADNTAPDARRTAAGDSVELRAERNPQGDGRVYRISFTAPTARGLLHRHGKSRRAAPQGHRRGRLGAARLRLARPLSSDCALFPPWCGKERSRPSERDPLRPR